MATYHRKTLLLTMTYKKRPRLRPRFLQSLFRTARRIDLALAGCLRGMIESGNVPTNPCIFYLMGRYRFGSTSETITVTASAAANFGTSSMIAFHSGVAVVVFITSGLSNQSSVTI